MVVREPSAPHLPGTRVLTLMTGGLNLGFQSFSPRLLDPQENSGACDFFIQEAETPLALGMVVCDLWVLALHCSELIFLCMK